MSLKDYLDNVESNKHQMGHNVKWEKMLTGNNIESNKRPMGYNVKW